MVNAYLKHFLWRVPAEAAENLPATQDDQMVPLSVPVDINAASCALYAISTFLPWCRTGVKVFT
jgi:hypothetical protein